MRRRFGFSLCFLLGFTLVYAQLPPTKSKRVKAESLLWKIEGKGLNEPSYVFGTIHMICSDNYFWTDSMQNALMATQQLCLELPMADTNMQAATMEALALPEGKLLKDYFSEADYLKISKFLNDSLGLPIDAFEQFKPFLLYSILALKSVDCETPIAYENKLMEKEIARKLPVIGLETLQEQLSIFEGLPKGDLSQMIIKLADSLAYSRAQYQLMVREYTAQHLDALYQLALDSPGFERFKDRLLDERNRRWVPKIEEIMGKVPTFFAVGAGHLPGKNGVLNLLRTAGYQVTAVR